MEVMGAADPRFEHAPAPNGHVVSAAEIMDFAGFEKANIVQRENYSFEVESDAQEWELAVDGIKTVEKKLKELSRGN